MITFQSAADLLYLLWESRKTQPLPTVFLVGPPGIGKTSVAREVHRRMGERALLEVRDLTSIPPEDLSGLPFREEGRTRYDPQEWMWQMCQPGVSGVLVLDDLPAAGPLQAVGCRQLALDRKIGNNRLSEDILLVVTGNRRQDKARASTLPSHFLNSVLVLEIEPDFTEWTRWFLNQGGNPLISAFLSRRLALFSTLPTEADEKGSFPTPRTWAMVSDVLDVARRATCLPQTTSGLVGAGASSEFVAFLHHAEGLPVAEEVIQDPRSALPHPNQIRVEPDKVLAVLAGISTLASRRVTQARNRDNAPLRAADDTEAVGVARQLLRAVEWIVGDRSDLLATAVSNYKIAGGSSDVLAAALEGCSELEDLRKEIREALR